MLVEEEERGGGDEERGVDQLLCRTTRWGSIGLHISSAWPSAGFDAAPPIPLSPSLAFVGRQLLSRISHVLILKYPLRSLLLLRSPILPLHACFIQTVIRISIRLCYKLRSDFRVFSAVHSLISAFQHQRILDVYEGDWGRELLQIANAVNRGKLVPESVIFGFLSKRLEDGNGRGETGFILDGIPRTRLQVEILDQLSDIDLVVNFKCSKDDAQEEAESNMSKFYKQQLIDFQVGSAPEGTLICASSPTY